MLLRQVVHMEAVGLEIDFPSAAHTMVAPSMSVALGTVEIRSEGRSFSSLSEVSSYLVRVHSSATAEASSR